MTAAGVQRAAGPACRSSVAATDALGTRRIDADQRCPPLSRTTTPRWQVPAQERRSGVLRGDRPTRPDERPPAASAVERTYTAIPCTQIDRAGTLVFT